MEVNTFALQYLEFLRLRHLKKKKKKWKIALWLFVEIDFYAAFVSQTEDERFFSKSAKKNKKKTHRVLRLMKQNMACMNVEPIHKSNLLPFNFWPRDRR